MGYEPVKEETKEQYLKIWTHYSVGHFTQEQLAKLFGCSSDTIYNAINWCAEHRIQFQSSVVAEAAKESLEAKLRELGNDLIKIKEKEPVSWNAVIGLEKMIFVYRELLWKFHGVIYDRNIVQINMPVSPEIQQIRKITDEIKASGMTQEERNAIADRLTKSAYGEDYQEEDSNPNAMP